MTSETINELEGTVKRADQLAVGDLVVEEPEYGKPPMPMRVALAHPFSDDNNNRMVLLVLDAFDGREPLKVRARADAKYDTVGGEQEWLFVFPAGSEYAKRFVRIFGTHEAARSRMNRIFGHSWRGQYDWRSFDAMGLPARTTELPESQWPASVEAARPELLRDWHFTFGSDHTLPDGTRLANRYVRMRDMTCDDSRAVMLAHFGNRWSNQYPSAEAAGVERFGLELLPSTQWPASVDDIDKAFLPTRDERAMARDGRCPACGHEAEHPISTGCTAPGGLLGQGVCGCQHPRSVDGARAGE